MAVVGSLVAKLSLQHASFTRGCTSASRSVTLLGRASAASASLVRSFGSALVSAVGPIMGFYGAFRAMRAAETFQQEMNSSLAIARNMTPALRKEMENLAKELAYQTKFSASELAKGYYYLFSAGLDANQALAALPVTAEFSQAAMADMAESTDILTDAITALGLDSKDSAIYMENLRGVADMIGRTSQNANASITQFGQAVTNKVGTALKGLRIPLSEGLAVLGAFASQSKKGEEAGTAFDIALRYLTQTAKKNEEAFARHGIRVFENGLVRAIGAVEDFERAMAGMLPEQKVELLMELGIPAKAQGYILALVGMSKAMREWEADNKRAGGAIHEIAQKQLPAFTKAWEKLKAVIEALAIDKLTPVLQGLGEGIGLLLDMSHNADQAANSLGGMEHSAKGVKLELEGVAWIVGKIADTFARLRVGWKVFETGVFAGISELLKGVPVEGGGPLADYGDKLRSIGETFGIMADETAAEGIRMLDDFLPSQKMLLEKYRQEIDRYREMGKAREPWDTITRSAGGGSAATAMEKTIKVDVQPPELARAGSQEAYDLIRRHLNPEKTLAIQQAQLARTTEGVALLARVEANTDETVLTLREIERELEFEDVSL